MRIVVVSESCYSGGMMRTVDEDELFLAVLPGQRRKRREPDWVKKAMAKSMGPAAVEPPRDPSGVRATVLMLAASSETQPAQGGLFTDCLLEVWAGGDFSGSYRELHEAVKRRVMNIKSDQEPQILMLGAPDPDCPRAPAFRPQREPVDPLSSRPRGFGG